MPDMSEMPTWLQQVVEAGYFAAMTKQPFNPLAMDEWQEGFRLYVDSHASKPSILIAASSSAANAPAIPLNI